MTFIQNTTPPIPKRLFHYTSASNALNIMTGGTGYGKEICFWLKNCRNKNDDQEVSLGKRLVDEVRNYLEEEGMRSMLEQIKIDETLLFANSFSEGKVSQHMLDEYGNVRLEFDFRYFNHKDEFEKCQYLSEEDLTELIQLYISDFKSVRGLHNINAGIFRIEREYDIISKIATLKNEKQWDGEAEWRHILHKQPNDNRSFIDGNNNERIKVFYPISSFIGVTIFFHGEKTEEHRTWYHCFKDLIKTNQWKNKSVQLRRF